MPLFINNDEQARTIAASEAISAMEKILREYARGDAIRRPRIDNYLPTDRPGEYFCMSTMEGGARAPGYYALRIKPDVISWPEVDGKRRRITYSTKPGLYGGLVLLYDSSTAELLAIMNDGYVQHLRVAATAALGAKYMAKPDADVLAIIGSGGMARFFAPAIRAVRPIKRIQVYSPNRARLQTFCAEIEDQLKCEVIACESVAAAVNEASVLSLCTSSLTPVIDGKFLPPGSHVTNVRPQELSPDAYARIDVVGLFVDRATMKLSGFVDDDFAGVSGDAMAYIGGQPSERAGVPKNAARQGVYPNARCAQCVNWESGKPFVRDRPDLISTIANISYGVLEGEAGASSGIQGLQFAAVGGAIYETARALGLGTELPQGMFLQDIPT